MDASDPHRPGGWAPDGPAMDGRIRAVQADPRFDAVLARAIEDVLSIYQARGWLSRIFVDRGHLVGGLVALYLHHVPHFGAEKPGLTTGRFQALCQTLGICSPGRAAALLSVMRTARYLEPEETAGDRRVRRLVPTERLVAFHWQRWSCFFPGAALALDVPPGDLLPQPHAREDAVAAIIRHVGRRFFNGFRLLHHAPELASMAESDGGIQLMSLFYTFAAAASASASASGGTVREGGISVPVSISACAGALGVSRAHIRKLLRAATDARLLVPAAGAVVVGDALAAPLRNFYAAVFVLLADAVLDALQDPPCDSEAPSTTSDFPSPFAVIAGGTQASTTGHL